MGRDEKKYFYLYNVGIEKSSWVLEKFLEDAKDRSMLEFLPKLIVQRLNDYYLLREQLQNGQQTAQAPQPENTAVQQAAPQEEKPTGRRRRAMKEPVTTVVQTQTPPADEELSEDDFLDAFGDL
jgi:hypothetical protein